MIDYGEAESLRNIDADEPQWAELVHPAMADSVGDVISARESKQTYCSITKRCHDARAAGFSHTGAIFVIGDIADIMHTILDRPVFTIVVEELSRRGGLMRQARDTVGRIYSRFCVAEPDYGSPDLKDLRNVWKLEIPVELCAGPYFSSFDPAMSLLNCYVLRGE